MAALNNNSRVLPLLVVAMVVVCAMLQAHTVCAGMLPPQTREELESLVDTSTAGCVNGDCGEPLFVTPLLQRGEVELARNRSKVTLKDFSHPSFSAFLTVNASTDSNLFFWFFPAQSGDHDAPLVIWLQGGPGASSLFGLFTENGPISVALNGSTFAKPYTWNSKYHMLYFDQPVGAGFSFTNSSTGYATSEDDVSTNMYSALTQFYTLFPDYQANDLYVTGESYGGKYVPAVSFKIMQENAAAAGAASGTSGVEPNSGLRRIVMNLQGLAIGDGWCDPLLQVPAYGEFMYNLGIIGHLQRQIVDDHMAATVSLIHQGRYVEAYHAWDLVWGDYPLGFPSLFNNFTGSHDTMNMMRTEFPPQYGAYGGYLTSAATRRAIHVGNSSYGVNGGKVYKLMQNDFMHSITPLMPALLSQYKVLVYNGQVDPLLGSALGEVWMNGIDWQGSAQWLQAPRHVWRITPDDTDVAGFVRCIPAPSATSSSATSSSTPRTFMAVVRGAGHLVPADQPQRAFDMIDRFISGRVDGFC